MGTPDAFLICPLLTRKWALTLKVGGELRRSQDPRSLGADGVHRDLHQQRVEGALGGERLEEAALRDEVHGAGDDAAGEIDAAARQDREGVVARHVAKALEEEVEG